MASSDGQIDKAQRGRPKRAELLGVNVNTGAQSINNERSYLRNRKFAKVIQENYLRKILISWRQFLDKSSFGPRPHDLLRWTDSKSEKH